MGKRGGGGRPSSFSSFSLSTLCALCCLMVVISYTLSYSYFQTESGNSWLKDFSKNVGATWAKRQNAKVYKFLGVTYQSYFPLVILSLVSLCAGGSAGTGPSSSLWSLRKMISRRGCPPRGRPQQEPQPQLPPHNSPPSVTRPPPIYTNQRFTIIFLVLNCLYFSLGMYRHSKDWEKSTSEILSSIANFLALSGLVNMSFFLIPVSKHSPVLVAFNLPMEQSLYVHQLAGLTSIVFYVLHGVLHMIRFVTERGDEDSSSAPRLWRLLFPPVGCWCADYEVDVETSECISCCSGIEGETKKGVETSCYYLWRNFTGLASAFFAVAIFFTSRQKMRRHSYRIFYICHVIFAPLMFLFAIWHWQRTYVFLLPSLTIHCIGFFVVHFSPTQAGVQVISVERIGGTDIYEMVVQCQS